MSAKIKELTDELQTHLKTAKAVAEAAEKDGDRDFTDDERAQVTEALEKAREVKGRLEAANGDAEMRKAVAELGDGIGLNEEPGDRQNPGGLLVPGKKSLGHSFTESKEYQELLGSVPGGMFHEKSKVRMRPVGYKTLVTGASDTSAGALVQEDWRGLQVGFDAFQRPLTLRDLVTNGSTTSDSVDYARIASTTNAAAPVAEATATAGTSGTKPESGFATVKVSTPVRTIAHWIPITKRAMSDAAQVRTLIDGFLGYGLEEELEDQMISGDGLGENLEGLSTVSGVQAQAWDSNLLTTLRKAKTKVRTVGRSMANGYVLNPADVEALDLLTDNENRYYFGGPSGTIQVGGNAPLWNLPIIESEAVPAGIGYVGDWRKAILWDREQASITMTDSHADFFIRNMVAILAEMRVAFGVIQPNAFVEIDLTSGV